MDLQPISLKSDRLLGMRGAEGCALPRVNVILWLLCFTEN